MASLFRGLLPNTEIDASVSMVKDKYGKSFLHCFALNLGQLYGMAIRNFHVKSWGNDYTAILEVVKSKVEFQQVLTILRDLIIHSSNLHRRAFVVKYSYDDRRRPAFETPFSAIVSGVMEQDLFRPATGDLVPEVTNISAAIRIWLQELMDLGINIVDYGQKEKEVQIFGSVNNVFHSMVVYISHDQTMTVSWCEHVYFTLLFNFGPTPCDWKFWCIEHLGDAFGEFWDMVDHPERVIPGSWDESHDVLNEE